uniref:Wsv277-like protein n=1 Tax=Metopaulias depressus WSSV-like virus TaxID=1675544 RepID=A0A0K0VL80_9VIRU|nr:wsv277-like protein [Metopaulias depressus WSSV-like virus]
MEHNTDVEETEILAPARAVPAELSPTDNSSSPENTTTTNKRKRPVNCGGTTNVRDDDEEQVLPRTTAKKAKRPRKNAPAKTGNTNNSFRYWQLKVEDSGNSPILEAVNTNVTISRALPLSPTSIGLKFVKSMTCQQVRAIVKDYQCGEITRMECSAFRKLDKSRNNKEKTNKDELSVSDKPSRSRIPPVNSYYTFTTVGETFAERVANVKKILSMSPVQKVFSTGDDAKRQHTPPIGISDIHFFEIDLAKGCFAARNKIKVMEPKEEGEQPSLCVKEFDLAKYYEGLVADIQKIDHNEYRTLIHKRNMRRHIKSWICICPYYGMDGVPPADDVVAKKGISTYRLFDNGLSIFQFESELSAITPTRAAEAMGAMHKSLCFQTSGNVVRKLLADIHSSNNKTLASMGNLNYRSKWRNNDKRATKCVKFYSVADDKKITDKDILDIVNTVKLFHNIHFREDDRAYGVAKTSGNQKIVPSDIKLSDGSKIRFTAITFREFNTKKAARGMNCFSTWRNGPKAKTFGNITSSAFSFDGLTKESVEKIKFQKRVKFLKAVKNEKEEDSYYGMIKTATSVKGCNLAPNNKDKILPEGKSSFGYKLETLEKEKLAIDFSRKEEKATIDDKKKDQEQKTNNFANNREEKQEEDDEEEPYEELC